MQKSEKQRFEKAENWKAKIWKIVDLDTFKIFNSTIQPLLIPKYEQSKI